MPTPGGVAWEMPTGRYSGSRRWPLFIPSRGRPQWLHEKRVAYSCRAAPVSHRIPVHLPAVAAVDAATAPMAKSLTQRVRDARACGDAVEFGFSDQQDTTHLPFREDVTGQKAVAGRSPGFRILLLTAPSRRHPPVVTAAFVPGHSGGSAPDSHRLPGLSLRKPPCNTSEKTVLLEQSAHYKSGRYQTASYLSRVMVSRSMPSMRMRRVSPSRLGEWNSPTS